MKKQEYIDALCKGAQVTEDEIVTWAIPLVTMKGYDGMYRVGETGAGERAHIPSTASCPRITSTDYTAKNLQAAISHLLTVRDHQRAILAEYWASPAGQEEKEYIAKQAAEKAEKERILSLAEAAGVLRGQHGSDYHTLSIRSTGTAQDIEDFQTVHPVYLIKDSRERTYSKAYTRRFGTGSREDFYLLGKNEVTGTAWIRAVPATCGSVRDALSWMWGTEKLLYRQGDVSLTECDHQPKSGWAPGSVEVAHSHVVTGEIARRGSVVYARKAELVHEKNQHATIIFTDCRRIVVARAYEKPRSRTSSD